MLQQKSLVFRNVKKYFCDVDIKRAEALTVQSPLLIHPCIIVIVMTLTSVFLELKPKSCDSSPCKNGGICSNEGLSFSCECVGNYQGKTCEGKFKLDKC